MSEQIPEEWSTSPLGSIADIRFSNVDKKSDLENEEPVKLCNYMDVYSNRQITNDLPFMNATAKDREIEKFTLEKEDVIITKDSETPDDIAVSAHVSEVLRNVICGYHLAMIRPNRSLIQGEYLNHLFGLDSVQHYFYLLANGITRFGLTADAINNASIAYPPLPEQQKIATILTSVDEVIEKTESQINKLQDLKKGMMQELLTKGIGHTEFKDSPVGRIPREWSVVKFDEITKSITCGVAATPKYVEAHEGIPFLSAQNVSNGKVVLDKYRYITHELHKKLTKNTKPTKGDILYSRVGANYGEAAVVEIAWEFSVYVSLTLIKINEKCDKYFIKYLLNSQHGKKQAQNGVFAGGGVPNLNVAVVKAFDIPLPSLDEQQIIAATLQSIDERIDVKREHLNSFYNLKNGLMQDLLTGKVRVKTDL